MPLRIRVPQLGSGGGVAYTLTASAGSFAITGVAANLTVSRTMAAATGSYTITGVDAAFPVALSLPADPGAYVITGNAANLTASNVATPTTPYEPARGGGAGGGARSGGGQSGGAKIRRITEEEIRAAWETAKGIRPAGVPAQVMKQVKAAVKRHALEAELSKTLPRPDAIDWAGILADNAAAEAFRVLIDRMARDEEEAILALLLAS